MYLYTCNSILREALYNTLLLCQPIKNFICCFGFLKDIQISIPLSMEHNSQNETHYSCRLMFPLAPMA